MTVRNDHGRVVEKTLAGLVGLGYNVDQGVIEASELGAAQKRRRHVIVASLRHSPDLAATTAHFNRAPRSVEWAIRDLRHVKPTTEFDTAGVPNADSRRRIEWLFAHDAHDLPDRLRPDCHRLKEHTYKSVYGRMFWDRPSQTITGGFNSMGQGRYVHPKERRTISPHEAARLQFIPDFFEFPDDLLRKQLAEMIGNAVPTKLTYAVALDLLR
jgi:DNA (cytosine-5)-methyltransferase 1